MAYCPGSSLNPESLNCSRVQYCTVVQWNTRCNTRAVVAGCATRAVPLYGSGVNRKTSAVISATLAEYGYLRPRRRYPHGAYGHRRAVWGAIWARAVERGWVVPREGELRPRTPPFLPPRGFPARIVAVVWWAMVRASRTIGDETILLRRIGCERFAAICAEARGSASVASHLARLVLRRGRFRSRVIQFPRGIGRLSAPRRVLAARASNWGEALDARAAAVIGAASDWERVFLLLGALPWHEPGRVVRQSQLDFAALQQARARLARVPPERRALAALGMAARALHDSCHHGWWVDRLRDTLIVAARRVNADVPYWRWLRASDGSVWAALRLAGGTPPSEVVPGLTRSEIAQWIMFPYALSPGEFVLQNANLYRFSRSSVTLGVARWIVAVHNDPARRAALYVQRTIRHEGREYQYQFISRIDEIREEDLTQGDRTGVVTAFERAAERFTRERLGELACDDRPLRPRPSWAERLPRFSRILNTPSELVREGDEMAHCVGTYSQAVSSGQSLILALHVRGQRSTVELSPDLGVVQHRGAANADPHPVCERALRAVLRWIRRAIRRARGLT